MKKNRTIDMAKKKTQEEFIKLVRSKNTHSLDLTNFSYINSNTKGKVIKIFC